MKPKAELRRMLNHYDEYSEDSRIDILTRIEQSMGNYVDMAKEDAIAFTKEYLEEDNFAEYERIAAVPTKATYDDIDPFDRHMIIQKQLEECRDTMQKWTMDIIRHIYGEALN